MVIRDGVWFLNGQNLKSDPFGFETFLILDKKNVFKIYIYKYILLLLALK